MAQIGSPGRFLPCRHHETIAAHNRAIWGDKMFPRQQIFLACQCIFKILAHSAAGQCMPQFIWCLHQVGKAVWSYFFAVIEPAPIGPINIWVCACFQTHPQRCG